MPNINNGPQRPIMNTSELGKIWEIYQSLMGNEDKSELEGLEIRLIPPADQLSVRYELSDKGGQILYRLIQHEFMKDKTSLYNSSADTPVGELIIEFIHSSYEGYEDWEKVVIQQVINDLEVGLFHWTK